MTGSPRGEKESMGIYRYIPRESRIGPHSVRDMLPSGTRISRVNSAIAMLITKAVGTMWCAYFFAIFDCLALPQAIHQGLFGMVQWVASFFLQLVLLSIIMVGQNIQGAAADKLAQQTYKDTEAILAECHEIHRHLEAQDEILARFGTGQPAAASLSSGEEVT